MPEATASSPTVAVVPSASGPSPLRAAAKLTAHALATVLVFPWLVERLPAAGASVELLLREHVQLLTMLSSLQLLAAGEVVVSEEELRRVGQGFIETLEAHSRVERELLERALETRIPA